MRAAARDFLLEVASIVVAVMGGIGTFFWVAFGDLSWPWVFLFVPCLLSGGVYFSVLRSRQESRKHKWRARWTVVTGIALIGCVGYVFMSIDEGHKAIEEAPTNLRPAAVNTVTHSPERHHIVGGGHFGCATIDLYDELLSLLIQGDEQAFTNALAAAALYGRAMVFEESEVVFVTDTKILSGMVQIRQEGYPEKWWTAMEAID